MKEALIQLAAAFVGALGFGLLFGLRRRHLFAASLGGLLAWGVYLLTTRWLGEGFMPNFFASAFSVFYAELLAHLLKSPATLYLTPAIIPLVPGGSLYYAMSWAVQGEMEQARAYGMATLKAALAIAAGISIVLALRELQTRRPANG